MISIYIIKDILLSFIVAVGFAMLFEAPKKSLWICGLLGGLGHSIRFITLYFGLSIVPATLCGTVFIGFAGIFFATRTETPPLVFTIPACITMIPGLAAYRTMIGCIRIYVAENSGEADHLLSETVYNFILTFSLLFCLAIGICISTLLFRKKSVRELPMYKIYKQKKE